MTLLSTKATTSSVGCANVAIDEERAKARAVALKKCFNGIVFINVVSKID